MSETTVTNRPSTSITLRDHLKVIFRQKHVIFITIFSVLLAAVVILELKTPVYEAQVKMLITAEKQVDSTYYRDMDGGQSIAASVTQSEIVRSKPVLQRTIEALSLDERLIDYESKFASPLKQRLMDWWAKLSSPIPVNPKNRKAIAYRKALNNLRERVKVEPVRDSNLFTISVRDFDPEFAAILANSISRSYVVFDLKQQYVNLKSKYTQKNLIVVQMSENIAKMERELAGEPLPSDEAIGPASVKIIEQSTPPLEPEGLPKKLMLLLAIAMSIPLAIVLAFTFEHMDQSFHSKQDLENFLGVPVIACINKKKGWKHQKLVNDVSDKNRAPRSNSYRILAQQILFMVKNKNIRTLFVVPTHPKDESGLILANVAVFLSKKLGLRTLIIDANLRRPHQHKIFSAAREKGLAEMLEEKIQPQDAVKTVGEKLDLVACGISETDPGILFAASVFSKALTEFKTLYDVVLVDGPDLGIFRDSSLIAPLMDGVILVVGESIVRRQAVQYAVNHLREGKCNLAGVIMPNRDYLIPKFIYDSL
jgi:capsular exopolysaccharide synthesis family protein